VLVTQLGEGQRATVLQLPVTQPIGDQKQQPAVEQRTTTTPTTRLPIG
jgi:hypothetical protein